MTLPSQSIPNHCSLLTSVTQSVLPKTLSRPFGTNASPPLQPLLALTLLVATGPMVKNSSQLVISAPQWILPQMLLLSKHVLKLIQPPLVELDANGDMVRMLLTPPNQSQLHCSLRTSAIQSVFPKTLLKPYGPAVSLKSLKLPALLPQVAIGLPVKN